jgi:hypothetical protein
MPKSTFSQISMGDFAFERSNSNGKPAWGLLLTIPATPFKVKFKGLTYIAKDPENYLQQSQPLSGDFLLGKFWKIVLLQGIL